MPRTAQLALSRLIAKHVAGRDGRATAGALRECGNALGRLGGNPSIDAASMDGALQVGSVIRARAALWPASPSERQ